jgi:tellurite resistance protein
MPERLNAMSPQDCLVAVMILVSASDETIQTAELLEIQQDVNNLPIFAAYDADRMRMIAELVFDFMGDEDGVDRVLDLVRAQLPEHLNETAYALACDVAVADGKLEQIELQMLQEIRHELNVDRLHAAAIERGARARHMRA